MNHVKRCAGCGAEESCQCAKGRPRGPRRRGGGHGFVCKECSFRNGAAEKVSG